MACGCGKKAGAAAAKPAEQPAEQPAAGSAAEAAKEAAEQLVAAENQAQDPHRYAHPEPEAAAVAPDAVEPARIEEKPAGGCGCGCGGKGRGSKARGEMGATPGGRPELGLRAAAKE